MKEETIKQLKRSLLNKWFFGIIFWAILIFMIRSSGACGEDKVLWLILCSIGFIITIKFWEDSIQ